MTTTKQFQTYIHRNFPGFSVQTSIFRGKLPRGSVDVYDLQRRLVLEVGTRLIGKAQDEYDLSCVMLGEMLAGQQARADYQK